MTVTYYTAVYRVDGDAAKHNEWWKSIRSLFMAHDAPVSVTAISKADEMTRLNCIEWIIEQRDSFDALDEIREILTHPDPDAWWRKNAEPAEQP